MLLQITNSCHMGCPHCLHNAKPSDNHMAEKTILQAMDFFQQNDLHAIVISGGEPTEHPQFERIVQQWIDFCNMLGKKTGAEYLVQICSNGWWCKDKYEANDEAANICKFLKSKVGHQGPQVAVQLQITSIPDLYKNAKQIARLKSRLEKWGKWVNVWQFPILNMQALGRAKDHPESYEQALKSPWYMSCLNLSQRLVQMPAKDAIQHAEASQHYCTPLVDWQGKVHVSESCLCPSIGHISDDDILDKLRKWRPCGQCLGYKKFSQSKDPAVTYMKWLFDRGNTA